MINALLVHDLGMLDYKAAWELQERTCDARATGERDADVLFFVEHPHVFTLGRRGHREHILDATDSDGAPIPTYDVNRGGDVTYHGPGQIVGYPIVSLAGVGNDVVRWLRTLEQALVDCLERFGIQGQVVPGKTGVWVEDRKIASLGIGSRRGVTVHGFALNANPDLGYFARIVPCGLHAVKMTSMEAELGSPVELAAVKVALAEALAHKLERTLAWVEGAWPNASAPTTVRSEADS
jgi:lipoate-protein ligase B